VNLTKNIFVPLGVNRVIIDLAYDPIDASEMSIGDLTYTIDYDNDGNVDTTGGMEPTLSGNRHEELDVGESDTNALWAFGIVGQGIKLQNPIRENSYVEVRLEYTMSVQLVLGNLGDEPYYIDFNQDNSMIAPLRFGSPSPGFEGGEVAMTVNYYDLDAVEYKITETKEQKREGGISWVLVVLGLVIIFI
jgi:hypothetical protein